MTAKLVGPRHPAFDQPVDPVVFAGAGMVYLLAGREPIEKKRFNFPLPAKRFCQFKGVMTDSRERTSQDGYIEK